MPGSSLWLIPPKPDNPFNKSMSELITSTIPSNFPYSPKRPFIPHVTLTSDIDPAKTYTSSPQEWLDALPLPTDLKREHNEALVTLEQLEAGDQFYKKLFIRAEKDKNLLRIASASRATGLGISEDEATKWAESEYLPHLSLFYGDEVSESDVQKKIGLVELQLGFEIGSLFDCCGGLLAMGGKIALVDTSKDVSEWKVLAEREVPSVMWKMARGLI